MARKLGLLLGILAPAAYIQAVDPAQDYGYAVTNIQPLNTTILGQYGHSPAVLPSPNSTGNGGWETAYAKAKAFVAQLTLEEKSGLVTGTPGPCVGNIGPIPRLGFRGLCLQDGPVGDRLADFVSVFSAGVAAAATWDKDILYERGNALGQEFRAKGAHVFLGPVGGPFGRDPYAGRNWEGFAPDPYLNGVAMEETIKGVQDAGVQATAKHFIGYEQEIHRQPSYPEHPTSITQVLQESVSSNIDDRTIHELYLWPFANAVRAGASTVMCSYNRVNGSYACQNSKTLNGLLKTELGFQGYVHSDWAATHSGVASIESGLDMDQPGGFGEYGFTFGIGSFFGANVTAAVKNGTVTQARLDDMVTRIMTPYYFLGQDADDFPTVDASTAELNKEDDPMSEWIYAFNTSGESSRDVRANHGALIRRHGAAGTVLLKNERNALPLKAPKSIAIFGNDAADDTVGPYEMDNDYEYGTLAVSGGSGTGRFSYLVTPLDAIKTRARENNALVQFWLNNTLIINSNVSDLWIPKPPEVCLVFLKTWYQELIERPTLNVDWHGNDVVEAVAKSCNNTIIVTHSGGVNILPWADHPNVTAILAAHYPGQESGNALADILYGDVNPSGKLPYTVAFNESDYKSLPTTGVLTDGPDDWQSYFKEQLEIDYRYFDAHNISVRYEFGYGLSYTTFKLANITGELVSAAGEGSVTKAPKAQPVQPGGNPALYETLYSVSVAVTNSGDVAGHAVPQLYVTLPGSAPAGTPLRQLRGFKRVFLLKGQTKTVVFELMRRDLSYWDVISQEWLIPQGEFTLSVGFSSRDLQLFHKITLVQ